MNVERHLLYATKKKNTVSRWAYPRLVGDFRGTFAFGAAGLAAGAAFFLGAAFFTGAALALVAGAAFFPTTAFLALAAVEAVFFGAGLALPATVFFAGAAFVVLAVGFAVGFLAVGVFFAAGFAAVFALGLVAVVDLAAAFLGAAVLALVAVFFGAGLFSFAEASAGLDLGASFTRPDGPLGKTKTFFSLPAARALDSWVFWAAPMESLYFVSTNFLIWGRDTPWRASSG